MNSYKYTKLVQKDFIDYLDDTYGSFKIGDLEYWASQILMKDKPAFLETFYDYANTHDIDMDNIDIDLITEDLIY